MEMKLQSKLLNPLFNWLNQEIDPPDLFPLSNFDQLCYELRPCDVLLIEGRNRISQIIKFITHSSWSHATLYIGRLHDIEDTRMREKLSQFYSGMLQPDKQLIIESLLGHGAIVSPLDKYTKEHLRICRPKRITPQDAQKVINYTIARLGIEYDFRQIFDLGRFLLPWPFLPRKWHSTLFNYKPGTSVKESCSSLLAEAFQSVHFPILPGLKRDKDSIKPCKRNPRLFTPRDFDQSPYFEIVKYPMPLPLNQTYKNWMQDKDQLPTP